MFLSAIVLLACNAADPGVSQSEKNKSLSKTSDIEITSGLPLDQIQLPPGFSITVYAGDVANARSMALAPGGTLFVGSRDAGNVYALKDDNNDHVADRKWVIANGLSQPNGVAIKDGDLYVAEISRISRFPQIESNPDKPSREDFFDDYPAKTHHGWKYIAFGPDGHLYVPVGAPCNICESSDEVFASMTRINMSTHQMEVIQHGIRNTVGFDWHPVTNELWFTDNGADWLGDNMPACELNYAPREGMHFGFPYCHQGDFPDPKLGKNISCSEYIPPVQKLDAHVAPLGMEFYTGNMFPAEYRNQIFIAEHGSWNRSRPQGYRIMLVKLNGNKAVSYEPFAEGWLQDGNAWGRPVDLEILPDGSLLVSDDAANVIYRIAYKSL